MALQLRGSERTTGRPCRLQQAGRPGWAARAATLPTPHLLRLQWLAVHLHQLPESFNIRSKRFRASRCRPLPPLPSCCTASQMWINVGAIVLLISTSASHCPAPTRPPRSYERSAAAQKMSGARITQRHVASEEDVAYAEGRGLLVSGRKGERAANVLQGTFAQSDRGC